MAMVFVQIVYWLVLAAWFGGALFIAVAWRSIFRTVEEANPILPTVLSVNLEGQHGTLLAGTIVGNLLSGFQRVQLFCAGLLALSLGGEALLLNLHDTATLASLLVRAVLIAAAAGVAVYDGWFVWPKMWQARQEFLDHADEPEKANPAKDRFDRHQRDSAFLLQVLLFCLLGILLFSVTAAPTSVLHSLPTETGHAASHS